MSPKPNSSILLYGPSGTGKTSMGRLLAEALALPFNDLDIDIETRSGRKIPEIFAGDGEPAFREMERAGLERLLNAGGVISLGGGALTHGPTRALAEAQSGRVLLLKANPDVIVTRLQADATNQRPLLQGDPHKKLEEMLERRGPHYAEFPLQLDTTHLSPAEAAWQAQILLGMFRVTGMGKDYDVRVAPGSIDEIGAEMAARQFKGPVALVSDENTAKRYAERAAASIAAAGYAVQTIVVPPGEQHKTLRTVERMWAGFLQAGIERGSTIVALGGGVLGDLTGFAAATWLRGIRWVNVPTTLLAMCDSSLGGKTGADLPEGKNLVGAFHPPALVLADPGVLATLPQAEINNGMAEVIKHGIIEDAALIDLCAQAREAVNRQAWNEIVSRSMAVKIKIIQEDPYEKARRQALNLGHTIGHAVELVSGFRIRHGEAVAIGMVAEARLAEKMGLADPDEFLAMRIASVCQAAGLPTEIPPELDHQAIRRAIQQDKKKAGGKVKYALPAAIGRVITGVNVEEALLHEL
ncbi:MAG: 3-dehydroquinate synthase [Chloroflexota bacterium]